VALLKWEAIFENLTATKDSALLRIVNQGKFVLRMADNNDVVALL
jgi:hypothetical protein